MRILKSTIICCFIALAVSACSRSVAVDQKDVVAATPSAITITSSRLREPIDVAQEHCAKHGKKAVSRGGVKIGSPYVRVMWGFDCVKE